MVQAAERSGSLITARLAAEQGRDVMAVPGDVRTGANAGGHALLRDGARLIERASDVLEELGWLSPVAGRDGSSSRPPPAGSDRDGGATGAGDASLRALLAREDGMTLDDLLAETGRSSPDLLAELFDLELARLVRRDEAGRFLPAERKW